MGRSHLSQEWVEAPAPGAWASCNRQGYVARGEQLSTSSLRRRDLWLPSDMNVNDEVRDVDLVLLYVGAGPGLWLKKKTWRGGDRARYSIKRGFKICLDRPRESTYLEDR